MKVIPSKTEEECLKEAINIILSFYVLKIYLWFLIIMNERKRREKKTCENVRKENLWIFYQKKQNFP